MKKQKAPLPGNVLKETYLDAYQIGITQFSEDVGLSASAVRQIINNKTKITLNVAARLAKYFNTTREYWINLQNDYDLAELQKDEELMAIIKQIPKAKKPSPSKRGTVATTRTTKKADKKGAAAEVSPRRGRAKKEAADVAPRKPRARKAKTPLIDELENRQLAGNTDTFDQVSDGQDQHHHPGDDHNSDSSNWG
ncbi:MAG: HigA family addiction module antidote protein [Treponema sp.]|jgi:addiction module HigA family antidote|nr:HigA family addiction module antidote protein [Treponema sp.]